MRRYALSAVLLLTCQVLPAAAQPYLGCYRDQGDPNGTAGRDLSGAVLQDPALTTDRCLSFCRGAGFTYAGSQYGTWCFCGNSYGASGAASNCNMSCAGNAAQTCGGAWANSVYAVIGEGNLYRESSFPEVYVMRSGRKVWIPTPDALRVMGHNWSQVRVVPDGTLQGYPRFNLPSSSPTPGSLVFPPSRVNHFPLTGVATAVPMASQGKEIQLIELYGWIRGVDNACGDGSDFHYLLELDTDWALSRGINLHRILRVGNIAIDGLPLPGTSPRKAVSLPLIPVELNSWGWHGQYPPGGLKPADWTFVGNCNRIWPFDHYRPDASKSPFAPQNLDLATRGPYVRIAGSLVTDHPHDVQWRVSTILSRFFAITIDNGDEWEGSVPDWHPGVASEDPEHFARWTEMHPPDLVEYIDQRVPRVTVRGVALAARVGILACEQAEFDLAPEAPRPAGSHVVYQELRGPECYFPWGQNADNGSWITVYDDHIHVRARVCSAFFGGSPGRFKALYRVWWS